MTAGGVLGTAPNVQAGYQAPTAGEEPVPEYDPMANPQDNMPPNGPAEIGYPRSGYPSSGYPSSGYPSSNYPSVGAPASGAPSGGGSFGGNSFIPPSGM